MKNTSERVNLVYSLYCAMILLGTYGLIMVCSASSYNCALSQEYNYDALFLFKKQAVFMILGFVLLILANGINYKILYRLSTILYVISYILIFLLLTPLGVKRNGAIRWIGIGNFQFQVAEIVKISVILFLGYLIRRYYRYLYKKKLVLYLWLSGGIPAVFIWKISSDLSSAVVILEITFILSFICTQTRKMHVLIGIIAVIAVTGYIMSIANHLPSPAELEHMSYRVGRIAAWLAPEKYAEKQGFQILQGLYAIGRGGVFGVGLGNSIQKQGVLPEPQTDMIFCIICEELGMTGAFVLTILFVYLLYIIMKISINCKDVFGSVITMGVMLHICIQLVINIAVNLNLFPNTGLTLPFISYGGTSLLLLFVEIGLTVSVARYGS